MRNDVTLSTCSSPLMPPAASPLDSMYSMVIKKSPPSVSIHAISSSTRFASKALERWRKGGARRRLKKEKEKEEQEELKLASLHYDGNGLTPVSYKTFSRHSRGAPQ